METHQALSESIPMDFPHQPLADALLQLGQMADLEISFRPDAVEGKYASAVKGDLPPIVVLNRWLEETGLVSRSAGDRRIIISTSPRPRAPLASLTAIRIQADPPGTYTYDGDQIQNTPTSNRDLSTLIESHPAIRINDASGSATNRGSLNVDDISIHGASPYQNQFQIDGMDSTSNLDPANKNLNLQIGNVPSNAQAYFVDTSLLDSVRVLDSFISSEYGRFTGGVIDARLRRASGDNRLQLTYRHNNSNMTKQKVAQTYWEDFENGALGFSKTWRKHFLSVAGDYTFNERSGMILNLSRRQSNIKRNTMTLNADGDAPALTTKTYKDQIDNLLGKYSLHLSASTITDLTVKYARRTEHLGSDFFRDTEWQNDHGAHGIAWNLEHDFEGGHYMLQAGFDHFLDERNSSDTSFITHFFAGNTRNNFTTGGFGKEETSRNTFTLKNRLDFSSLQTGPIQHSPYIGLDIQRISARFKRHQDALSYQKRYFADGTIQERSKNLYHAGSVNVDYNTYAAYVSNRMNMGRTSLTVGARYDKETFIGRGNIAPRTRLDWDATGSGNTVISIGWNRYYGNTILAIGWNEEKSTLQELLINSKGEPVHNGRKSPEHTQYKTLRTPYDDEWAFQITQRFGSAQARLNFVQRNGRDQISRTGKGTIEAPYIYTNNGFSRHRTWSLMLQNAEPWHAMGATWQFNVNFSHVNGYSNSNLEEGYDEDVGNPDDFILLDGNRIRRMDRPAMSFNRPSQASLGANAWWPSHGIHWNNTVTWRGTRDAISYVGTGPAPERLERYETVRVPAYWTWDTAITWKPGSQQNLSITAEVLNVLNRQPTVVPTAPNRKGNQNLYRTGREIWLQASYEY